MDNHENTNQDAIYQTANHLADLLRSCPEYIRYIDAKNRLFNDPANKQLLEDLRKKQLDLDDNILSDEETAKREKFFNDFLMSVALNPAVNEFLNAEYNFGRIIEQLSDILGQVFPDDDWEYDFEVSAQEGSAADKGSSVEATYIN